MTVTLTRSLPATEPWTVTTATLRELDEVPRCGRCRTPGDRRACRALGLKRDGLDWVRVAREVGYTNGAQARRCALAHLEAEA